MLSIDSNYLSKPSAIVNTLDVGTFSQFMHWYYLAVMHVQMLLQNSQRAAIHNTHLLCLFTNIDTKNEAVLLFVV
jgi:hypothetical protein